MENNTAFKRMRRLMVDTQLTPRGIHDRLVLDAMATVPRERFVPDGIKDGAYNDGPLPVGEAQTISQPFMVALMTQSLELSGKERVLEIGTGSGYQAAVLAQTGCKVFSVERISKLAKKARRTLELQGYVVEMKVGDGTLGWEEESPFDRVIVTAGGPRVPEPLIAQLKEGGKLVMPVGETCAQKLLVLTKTATGSKTENLCECRFVKLIGKAGWEED